MKLEIGDVVKIIGTNTLMVVEDVMASPLEERIDWKYTCVWFDKNDVLHRDKFTDTLLMKVEE